MHVIVKEIQLLLRAKFLELDKKTYKMLTISTSSNYNYESYLSIGFDAGGSSLVDKLKVCGWILLLVSWGSS